MKENAQFFCPISAACVALFKVCGVDLRDASHEQAVEAIRRAGVSVIFLVQSGQQRSQVRLRKLTQNALQCVYAGMHTLRRVAFRSLEARGVFHVKFQYSANA